MYVAGYIPYMKTRSLKKIEKLVEAEYPNTQLFRTSAYEQSVLEHKIAISKWEEYRDRICSAGRGGKGCVCNTDSRLVAHPLRVSAESAARKVNDLSTEAYRKLTDARAKLTMIYLRVNELKDARI